MTHRARNVLVVHWRPAIAILLAMSFALIGQTCDLMVSAVHRPDTGALPPVIRAQESIKVVGSLVAMSQDVVTSVNADGVAYVLAVKVRNQPPGKKSGIFVRADFALHGIYSDNGYDQMAHSLRQEGKLWKIHLRPPTGTSECAFAVPPPPGSGDEIKLGPIMLPVGKSKEYPDINSLTCYAFEVKDIKEVESPDN